jgi:methionine synthase I (cobalamin-dependent)
MARQGDGFLARLKRGETLVFDGAMGTMLFAAGLTDGACPELWNATHPDVVRGIHRGYFEAGSDFVETNTFGGTRLKLTAYGLQDRTRELNVLGAKLAREVCPPGGLVAGSIGPTGHLPDRFAPLGDVSEQTLTDNFREQAEALAEGGVDLFAIETMMYPEEAFLAIRAAKEAAGLPVMCTMFFQFERDKGRDDVGDVPGGGGEGFAGGGGRRGGDELWGRGAGACRGHRPGDAERDRRGPDRLSERRAAYRPQRRPDDI